MTEMGKNKKIKVAIGMSGGVDSSVAAALLKQQGYDVVGVFMRFWSDPTYVGDVQVTNKCCSVESMQDARRVATILDIPFITLNLTERFKDLIVDNFLEAYEEGKTPNPCVVCNQFIKVGYFLDKARELGCDYVATGHYSQTIKNEDGSFDLLVSKDGHKDQTYFLHRLSQETIAHTLFPIGHITKPEVRELAEKFGLPVAKKKDSHEISFVPDTDHNDFLKRWLKMVPGEIVNTEGEVVGKHDGLPLYTLGQRKGLQITKGAGPFFVVKKDHKNNQLTVTNQTDYPGLFTTTFEIEKTNWINKLPEANKEYRIKLRHMHTPTPGTIVLNGNKATITLLIPQRAVTPGQSAVVYDGEIVMGGGIINFV